MKIALGVEYDGTGFVGWQRQRQGRTVQACVEDALSRIADTPVTVQCAGRTDAGVHANAQVIHFESPVERPNRAWVLGTNSILPPDVSVQWACPVPDAFHARFSAESRSYRYIICNRPSRPGLWSGKVTFCYGQLDAVAMLAAARHLVGKQDFTSFRAAGCQAHHAVREVLAVDVRRAGEFVVFGIEANAFLQHMVRNIVGTLLPIGRGESDPASFATVIALRDRRAAGITAPPDGLYLESIRYPQHFDLPPSAALFGPWSLA